MLEFFGFMVRIFNSMWTDILGKIEIADGVSFASFVLVGIIIGITVNVFWRGAKK